MKYLTVLFMFVSIGLQAQCPDTTVAAVDTILVNVQADSVTYWEARLIETDTDDVTTKVSADFGTSKANLITFLTAQQTEADSLTSLKEDERAKWIDIVDKYELLISDHSIQIEKYRKKRLRIKQLINSL